MPTSLSPGGWLLALWLLILLVLLDKYMEILVFSCKYIIFDMVNQIPVLLLYGSWRWAENFGETSFICHYCLRFFFMVNPKSHSKIRTQHTASDFSFSFPMKRYHKLFLILNINFHSSVFLVVRIHGWFLWWIWEVGQQGIIEFVLPKFSGEERKEEDKIRICHIKK